ncbi:hypothetical protein AVEN_173345-1 [Araneus ventricosus]|uniref:Uncharacterized protein n=1 Tax=Araneus ventricosus TaxID=182803 RepID=A0A4Y2ICY5_ARAVE|nr:hypothetical protein AVEN_173345-1 [Araneus ventricosus]
MGIEISPTDKKIDICKKIKESLDFEEEFVRDCLEVVVTQREREAAELKTKREAEAQTQALREEREYELEKMRISNAAETNSLGSAQNEIVRPRCELGNLMQKYDAKVAHISLYLAMLSAKLAQQR